MLFASKINEVNATISQISHEIEDLQARIEALRIEPTFRTLSCHREKLRREKIKVSIKINIRSEKRHLRNSKAPKMASKPILNKEQ